MEDEKGKKEPDATLKGLEYFPNLEEFYWCMSINLPELDLSGNPKLKVLYLSYSEVGAKGPYRLDLSANHALESLTLSLNLDKDELILPADAVWKEKKISKDGTAFVNGTAKIPKPEPAQAIKPGALTGDGKGDIRITKNIFPDNKFRRYLYVKIDANWDGILSEDERMAVSRMGDFDVGVDSDDICWNSMWYDLQKKKMDFTGIGYFPNIEEMRLPNLTITNLDFRQFKRLRTLRSYNSKYPNLTTLDLSENMELEDLLVSYSKLSSLNVSKNQKLKSIFLCRTKVKTLNLKKNSELVSLNCSNNFLKKLDLSKCPKLKELYCEKNKLTKLVLSRKIKKMTKLDCCQNRLKKIRIGWIKIKSLKKDKKTKI